MEILCISNFYSAFVMLRAHESLGLIDVSSGTILHQTTVKFLHLSLKIPDNSTSHENLLSPCLLFLRPVCRR